MNKFCFALFLISLVSNSVVLAQQPIKAPETFDRYKLSNIRIEDDSFGRASVICDYKRIKVGEESHSVRFVARTESGKLDVMGSDHLMDRDSGVIALSKIGVFGSRKYNYEIYLIADAHWAGKTYGPCIISNSVRIGNPGRATNGRAMNPEEKSAYQRHIKGKNPPTTAPPAGYELANLSSGMLPGMYVMAGRWGDWEKAEFLGLDADRNAKLRFQGENMVTISPVEEWVAVDPDDIAKGKQQPGEFEPSGTTLDGGKLLLPLGAVALDSSIALVPGTPMIYEMGGRWRDVVFTSRKGSKISVMMADFGSFSRTEPFSKFAIKKTTIEELKQPGAKDKFANNIFSDEEKDFGDDEDVFGDEDFDMEEELADIPKNAPQDFRDALKSAQDRMRRHRNRQRKRLRDYPIDSPIPRNCQIVPKNLKIPKGTKVAACFHSDWSPATVISDPGDGTLEIDWDDHASAWNGRVARDQMIIQNKTVEKIKAKASGNEPMTAKQLAKVTRTWTDSSGQHKVKAKFVRKTDDEVVLKLEDGYEKTLPLSKLSKQDRELLANLKPESDNPFER